MTNSGPLFEFWEPGGGKQWVAAPGKQTTFPLSIRNETGEGHDIAVLVEEPASWAWADPQRISLNPGDSTTVSIVFAPHRETTIAAGVHQAAIRLRDLEGVIFAECLRSFEVEERQELAMTVTLRGPLMSFGQAEGFVLHCTLANRGNVDVSVTPVGDEHPTLTFSKRTVAVPFQGEVAFDIEVRWNATLRSNHPSVVTLRAPYRDGEASASIEWRYIAEALEPFMPIYSTTEEEDEFLSLSWLPQPDKDLLEHRLPNPVEDDAAAEVSESEGASAASLGPSEARAASDSTIVPSQQPGASRLPQATVARRDLLHAPARRLSPWWPVVQRLGGKWRVKPLPILMFIIGVEGFLLGMTEAQKDFYASPELLRRVPTISRVFPHVAATVFSYGKRAITATFHESSKVRPTTKNGGTPLVSTPKGVPALWGLSAHYLNPQTLLVSFHETHCNHVALLVASGLKTIYKKSLSMGQAKVPIPRRLLEPLRVTVVAQAPDGIELRQQIGVALPLER